MATDIFKTYTAPRFSVAEMPERASELTRPGKLDRSFRTGIDLATESPVESRTWYAVHCLTRALRGG